MSDHFTQAHEAQQGTFNEQVTPGCGCAVTTITRTLSSTLEGPVHGT